jgi:tetratricopeptide (TPR) repeat protein
MRTIVRVVVGLVALAAILASFNLRTSSAQIPDEFENLKVLPKDISKRDLVPIMRSFSQALGVRCNHCHVAKPGSDRLEDIDFASEENPKKETARAMMKMVASINEMVTKTGLESPTQVRCVTCHHGIQKPESIDRALTRTVEKDGVTAGVDRYRALRKQYYGSAAYDFTPQALTNFAGELADAKKNYDGAVAFLNLGLEYEPNDVNTHLTLGRVLAAKGDKAGAEASYKKVLELDPGNRWAKDLLEKLQSGE